MSNLPSASPASAPAAPTQEPPKVHGALPESAGFTPNSRHDASEFFEKHKAANGEAPAAAPAVPVAAPKEEPKATPAVPVEDTSPKGLASKLAAKRAPAAPKAEPAATPTPDGSANPEDSIVLDSKYSKPAHESFNQIKGITKGLRDQLVTADTTIKDLRAQLEAAKKGTPTPDAAEIDRLRAEHKLMSERLSVLDLREHPEFASKFVAPRDAALQEAQSLLEANGVTGVDLAQLLSRPRAEFGKAVSEAATKLSTFDATDFADRMRTAYGLKQQADAALAKSREVYGALRNQTEERHKQAFAQTWDRAASSITEHLVELEADATATPEQKAAVEEYNTSVRGLRSNAERIALGASRPEEVAANAIKAAAYDLHIGKVLPRVLGEYESLLTLNKQLTDQLKAIRERNPNRQGSPVVRGGAGDPVDPSNPANMDHRAAAEHFFNRPTS